MKNIIILILVSISLFGNSNAINLETINKNKLIELEAIDKPITNLVLAQAYEIGFPERGIQQDIEKSISLYKKVYDANKDPIASNKLGMYYFTKEVKENKDYKSEEYFINGINKNDLGMTEYNSIMAGVVYYKKKNYKNAINYLFKYANKKVGVGNPSAEIYLAFTYNELKNNRLATKYLTRACSNPKSTEDILNFCRNNVIKEDLNKLVEDLENL